MTIAERRAREAYDRENPWRPIHEAKPDGTVCELRFSINADAVDMGNARYFLHESGLWYRIDLPQRVPSFQPPNEWRPVYAKVGADVQKSVRIAACETLDRAEYFEAEHKRYLEIGRRMKARMIEVGKRAAALQAGGARR